MTEISYNEFKENLKNSTGYRPEKYHWDSQGHKTSDDHLYFISNGNDSIKIGRSKDVDKRVSYLQTSNHAKLEILCVIEYRGFLEPIIHSCFSEERIRGEWFADCDRIRDFIDYVYFHPKPSQPGSDVNEWIQEFMPREINLLNTTFGAEGNKIMLFGKHKGEALRNIPMDYMMWFVKNVKNKELVSYFSEFLKRFYEENTLFKI